MHDEMSPLAQRLGRYMAEQCTDGLDGLFGDDLLEAFPEEDRKSISFALVELKVEGLVKLTPVMGPYLDRVQTTVELFKACDAAITGHDPVEDSVELARLLLEKPSLGGNAAELELEIGWERRRFNPAFALLIPCVADGRVRKTLQNTYPTLGLLLADEDILELRRYVRRHSR
ncbi:hypothetical protein [Caulobacter sp. UNC279MFTsu5.1]|uniref:hypothetical protein n=1 Tax=Caulobacter sp. UNC279MFTsu5.1 TaxID=1502775 RepID=UPI0003685998|nr:hypothetical protein [Caulobacter sp. UNC279MFTsu5.1]